MPSSIHACMLTELGRVCHCDLMKGGDDVFMCVRNSWNVDVRRYVTEVGYQTPIQKDTSPLYDVQGEVGEDERVSCRFRRPLKVTHDSEDQFSIDLNNNWFQLYAWGPISASKQCFPQCQGFQGTD